MFGIIPKRYKELNLPELDTYFAMARGFQGEAGNKLFGEYKEAKTLGIETKLIVTGAYTMIKLCRYTGEKTAESYVDAVLFAGGRDCELVVSKRRYLDQRVHFTDCFGNPR